MLRVVPIIFPASFPREGLVPGKTPERLPTPVSNSERGRGRQLADRFHRWAAQLCSEAP